MSPCSNISFSIVATLQASIADVARSAVTTSIEPVHSARTAYPVRPMRTRSDAARFRYPSIANHKAHPP